MKIPASSRPSLCVAIFAALCSSAPAQAGSRWLANDGYVDGAKVGFQGGFITGECWGSVYVPSGDEYPFSLEKVRMLVGGSNGEELFTIAFYNISGTTMNGSGLLGSEAVYVTGSDSAWNEVTVADLKLGLSDISSGNVGVAVCLEEHSGYPAISRDTDGMAHSDRNYIYADAGAGSQWYPSNMLGLTGDWIMRLCIDGDGVSDEGCSDGGSTGTGTGDGGSTSDGGSTDGGSASDGGSTDGGSTDGGSTDGGTAAAVEISSITPATVAEGEAIDIVVLGQGFSDEAEARIGGITIVGNDVLSDTTIQGRTPTTLPVGVHDVEVVDGSDSVVLAGAFEVTGGGCGCASAGGSAGGAGLLALMVGLLGLGRRRETVG